MASCRFQRKCGKCWANGHIGTNCSKAVSATVAEIPKSVGNFEPGFGELLADPRPYPPPLMPEGRPQKVDCFIERDEEYFKELEALSKSVVVHNLRFQRDFSTENIAGYAVKTGLVTKEDIQVSALPGHKYLIRMPPSVSVEAFIKATPYEAWEEGLSFQQWTPLEEAATVIPRFKILLELIGVPVILWREQQIVKAVSQFGVFLGTVEPEEFGSLESWMVAVGTDDLAKIPHNIAMHVGGMQFPISVRPVTWKRSVLYKAEDFPTLPVKFSGPSKPVQTNGSHVLGYDAEEIIPLTKSTLMEICKGKNPSELPPELRQFAIVPANSHGNGLHNQLQSYKKKDPIVEGAGQNCALDGPATQRLHGSGTTKRNLFHQEKSNSLHNMSQESGVRCTPGFNETPDDVMNEVASPVKLNSGKQQGIPHDFQQQKSAVATEIPRLIRRNSGNVTSISAEKYAINVPQSNREGAQKEGHLPTAIKLVQQGNKLKGKEVIEEVNRAPAGNSHNSSTNVTLKEFRFRAQQKRKNVGSEAGPSRPPKPMHKFKRIVAGSNLHPLKALGTNKRVSKPLNNRPPKRAQVHLNAEGYFEVKVNSTHVQNLANGCGFKSTDVQQIIDIDNASRVEEQRNRQQVEQVESVNEEEPIIDSDVEEALARFELDPDDDLVSEEEN